MATVALGSVKMPVVGFGCYKVGVTPASASSATTAAAGGAAEKKLKTEEETGEQRCNRIVKDALASGYRLLDNAQFYMNEAWVGSAIKASGVPRKEVFVLSKVWNDIIWQGPEAVTAQVDKSIAELQCEYLDVCLVHWPVPGKHVDAYKALLACKAAGKIKEVGVSNYTATDYEELRAAGVFGEGEKDKPVMNQIEVNPMLFRKSTIDFFKGEGVHIQSYRGLMQCKGWDHPVVQEVCTETGKAPCQVLGRFLVQQGISHVPKASSPERMRQNADLFGFKLSVAQMDKLLSLTTPDALKAYTALYEKCIVRDTPAAK